MSDTSFSIFKPSNDSSRVCTSKEEEVDGDLDMSHISRINVCSYEELNKLIAYKDCDAKRKADVRAQIHEKEKLFTSHTEKSQRLAEMKYEQTRNSVLVNKIEKEKSTSSHFEERKQKEINQIETFLHKENEEGLTLLHILREKEQQLQTRFCYFSVLSHQKRFKATYERVTKVLTMLENHNAKLADSFQKQLQPLVAKYEKLLQKSKTQHISNADIDVAEQLVLKIERIEDTLHVELKKIQAECLKESKLENKLEEPKTSTVQHVVPLPPKAATEEIQKPVETAVSTAEHDTPKPCRGAADSLKFYDDIMNFYKSKVDSVKSLQGDTNLKKYRSSCQKAINIPLNAISAVNPQHLQDKYDKLYSLISGSTVKTPDGIISAAEHPQGIDFCLLSLAKKFVGQGDSAISSNLQAAFPTASMIVALWNKFPELGKLFLAYMFKESPFLVPYYIPHAPGQTTEDYCRSLGYRVADNQIEKQDMYLKRQSGLMRLYAAIMITEIRSSDNQSHPYSIENGWKWICNILNMEPLPDICATLIFEFLQIAGNEMWKVYGKQFSKILRAIQTCYLQKLSKVDEGGPKTRLEVFISKVMEENRIEQPPGILPSGFW